jgi:hypothetical protein
VEAFERAGFGHADDSPPSPDADARGRRSALPERALVTHLHGNLS